jgi:hypothetical protein
VEDTAGFLAILAVFLPSKQAVKQEQVEDFYNTLQAPYQPYQL